MKKLILLSFLLFFLTACGVHKNIPQVVQRDTTYIHHTNTEYVHDSVTVFKDRIIREKGDTVYITETLYKDRWRDRYKTDTLYKDRIKEVEKEVIKEVEKPLSFFQKLFITLGKVLSIVALLYGAYLLLKTKLKIKL